MGGLETEVNKDCGGITRGGSPELKESPEVTGVLDAAGRPDVADVMGATVNGGRYVLGDETGKDKGFAGLPTGEVILGEVI